MIELRTVQSDDESQKRHDELKARFVEAINSPKPETELGKIAQEISQESEPQPYILVMSPAMKPIVDDLLADEMDKLAPKKNGLLRTPIRK